MGARWYYAPAKSDREKAHAEDLLGQTLAYRRVGFDERPMKFLPDGRIGEGAAGYEVYWDIRESTQGIELALFSSESLTCRLKQNGDGWWVGNWEIEERMPIEIAPERTSVMDLEGDCFPPPWTASRRVP